MVQVTKSRKILLCRQVFHMKRQLTLLAEVKVRKKIMN